MTTWIEEYSIPTRSSFELALPEGSKFLSAAFFKRQPKMWFSVPKRYCETHARCFFLTVTGGDVLEGPCEHLATLVGTGVVAHLFEIK